MVLVFLASLNSLLEEPLPAYLISELETLDAELFEKYKSLAQVAIAKYGGRYLARGASIETAEGDPS